MHFLHISAMLALALLREINSEDCQDPKYAETSHFDDIYLIKESNEVPVTIHSCSQIVNGENEKCRLYSDDCSESFRTGVKFVYGAKKYYPVKVNSTVHYSEKKLEDGNEQQLNISITLSEYTTVANLIGNEIKLKSGTICRFNVGKCFDAEDSSEATWDPTITDEENNNSVRYTRIPLENTTSYVVTLKKNPLIRYAIIDKEDTTFALQLLRNSKYRFMNIWNTNIRDLQVAFKTNNFGTVLYKLSTVDSFLGRETSLNMQPKELVYDMIMDTCILQSRIAEENNSTTAANTMLPTLAETEFNEIFKRHASAHNPDIENATQEYILSDTISDSTAIQLLGENFTLIILIASVTALFVIYILYNIILNCLTLQSMSSNARTSQGRNYMCYSLSQGLTIRHIYNTLQHEINILKIRFFTSRHDRLDSELSQRDFMDGNENPYERPLSSQYMII